MSQPRQSEEGLRNWTAVWPKNGQRKPHCTKALPIHTAPCTPFVSPFFLGFVEGGRLPLRGYVSHPPTTPTISDWGPLTAQGKAGYQDVRMSRSGP